MNRREFIAAAGWAGLGSSLVSKAVAQSSSGAFGRSDTSWDSLLNDCRTQLFDEYLPFWEQGGIDEENGGFMCYLYNDGSVENNRKDIWYQGRGIWVYSYIYNELDKDPKWLEIARRARDFMVEHMHRGDGTWMDTVDRDGKSVDSIAIDRSNNIYGALFAAVGLIQFAKATGSEEDLELARLSLKKSFELYEESTYSGVVAEGVTEKGLRAQGHSFMFIWALPQFLELDRNPWCEGLLAEHLDRLASNFWNPEYGISNEILYHDYSRIPSQSAFMVPGHSIEAQWMGMEEAKRSGNGDMHKLFKNRLRRLIEMSWDYPFEGTCDTGYHVHASDQHPAGPILEVKTMWAQTEVAVGCLLAFEHSRETWAQEWFERSWSYLQRTMTTDHGVWRQAVDREGRDLQREGISIYRKGNFHQPRCLMYLMQALRRMKVS